MIVAVMFFGVGGVLFFFRTGRRLPGQLQYGRLCPDDPVWTLYDFLLMMSQLSRERKGFHGSRFPSSLLLYRQNQKNTGAVTAMPVRTGTRFI